MISERPLVKRKDSQCRHHMICPVEIAMGAGDEGTGSNFAGPAVLGAILPLHLKMNTRRIPRVGDGAAGAFKN